MDDDDDFQSPSLTLTQRSPSKPRSRPFASQNPSFPLKPSNNNKRFKLSVPNPGKENRPTNGCFRDSSPTTRFSNNICTSSMPESLKPFAANHGDNGSHDSLSDCFSNPVKVCSSIPDVEGPATSLIEYNDSSLISSRDDELGHGAKGLVLASHSNSIEARLLAPRMDLNRPSTILGSACGGNVGLNDGEFEEDFEPNTQLEVLLNLCSNESDGPHGDGNMDPIDEIEFPCPREENESGVVLVCCPLCGIDISDLNDELRQVHTNGCLDKGVSPNADVPSVPHNVGCPQQVSDGPSDRSSSRTVDVLRVVEWLRNLGLGKYEEVFSQEEIDWDTLQCLTEEDLLSIGVTALGPRKKIVHALQGFRTRGLPTVNPCTNISEDKVHDTSKVAANKLITDYFAGSAAVKKNSGVISNVQHRKKSRMNSGSKQAENHVKNRKLKDIPSWCCIPGTPFRVDAFRYLRRDCSYWFLTHFHLDHYQGLTRSFCHGNIYCSLITAKLVNMKLGIPWERLQVLPINQKITIAGIDVTCIDANHCPGSIIIVFEPPDGKVVLHTGDFRFHEGMEGLSAFPKCPIHTLILDTTYCNPEYDFPKQEAVIQFVIEAVQAEAFNTRTLFLIGSYTIGKERLFLEVAHALRKKVYVTAARMRLLECLGLPEEDMQWLTMNEQESHIHVVPMWTLASFKRLKLIADQYAGQFSLVVAFSPTGWTFGKGKKKSPGRRSQQGTIIKYEVPYSEHCSFSEMKRFVELISPVDIIPSVNNVGPESANAMLALLT